MPRLYHPKNNNIYKRTPDGFWYCRVQRRGRRVELSTHTSNVKLAQEYYDRLAQELAGNYKKKTTNLICDEIDLLLELKKTQVRASTYTRLKSVFELHLMPYWGGYLPSDITEASWEEYIVRVQKKKKRTMFNDFRAMNMLISQCIEKKLIASRPKLRMPDSVDKKGYVYAEKDLAKLLKYADGYLKTILTLAITMGMRKGEILGLEWDRVDLEKKTIKLRTQDTKTKSERVIPMSSAVFLALRERYPKRMSAFVFPAIYQINKAIAPQQIDKQWRALRNKLNLKGRFHDLRHTFLTKAFRDANIPHAKVCVYAGLSMQTAMKIYLHYSNDDLREVAELFND